MPDLTITQQLNTLDDRLIDVIHPRSKAAKALVLLHGYEVRLNLTVKPDALVYVSVIGFLSVETDADRPFCCVRLQNDQGTYGEKNVSYVYFSPEDITGFEIDENDDMPALLTVTARA